MTNGLEPDGPPLGEPAPVRSSKANALVFGLGGVLLLAALGVLTHVLTTRSRDAVVDAEFIELDSPISGELEELLVEAGDAVTRNQRLALVRNPRANEAEVNQLRTALATAEAELERSRRQLQLEQQLLEGFRRDASDSRQLETARARNDLDHLRATLERERQEVAFSARDTRRQEELFQAGAVSETVVDRARTTLQENREQVRALEARIRAQSNRLQASERDLSLDRTRSASDPLPRLQQSQLKINQLEGDVAADQRRVQGLTTQLQAAQTHLAKQRSAWLLAPKPLVVWKVQGRSGDSVRPQQALLRLVDCQRRSVTTYLSEKDLRRVHVGSAARVDLIGETLDLHGRVDLIRSGVGRLGNGDAEPGPLPTTSARQGQVRVRINSDVPAPPRKLCFVGYSARVTFP
mgnify:CR=1 FL=1|jgi:multidrug resistance efflux pump